MAWRYRIVGETKNHEAGTVDLQVDYYDDAGGPYDPATKILRRDVSYPAWYTTALIQADIKHEGIRERTKRQAVDALADAIPANHDAPV